MYNPLILHILAKEKENDILRATRMEHAMVQAYPRPSIIAGLRWRLAPMFSRLKTVLKGPSQPTPVELDPLSKGC